MALGRPLRRAAEVGDTDRPKLVFFFDEAHLLFSGASRDFLEQVVQTVRLIRSKGVGVFFVTQTPKDVPADVLAQLGNRVQHSLRAFTPADQKALRLTAQTFPDSDYDLEKLLTSMGTGEAVVTVLRDDGAPSPVAWTKVRAPESSMQPAPTATVTAVIDASPSLVRYGVAVDSESAYELLSRRIEQEQQAALDAERAAAAAKQAEKDAAAAAKVRQREGDRLRRQAEKAAERNARTERSAFDSLLRSAGSALGREITRSIFGTRRRR